MTDETNTPPTEATPRLALKPREAARALGVGERLLWSWTNQGLVPHLKMGKRILYPVLELQRWLSEQAAKAVRR